MAITSEICDVALETFAEWFAHHVHFAPRSGEALARLGIAAADFERARTHWEGTLQADMIVAERDERILLFGQCFTAVRKRLRAEKPTIESLGPLPALPAPLDPTSAPVVANVVPAPATAPQPAPAKATYQLDEPRAAPTPAEQPRSVGSSFDPDDTLPIPAPFVAKPAVPFAGETPPEKVAQMFDPVEPRARGAEPGPDETALTPLAAFVMPRTGTFRDQLTPLAVPILSLDEYAELRARLTVFGEDHAPTLTRFGVAVPEVHEAQRARFSDYFLRDPGAQAAFLNAMQAAIVRVREERDAESRSEAERATGGASEVNPSGHRVHADVDATGEIDSRHVADVLRAANVLPFDKNAPAKPPPPSAPQQQSGQTELIKAFDLDELLGSGKSERAPALPMPIERFAQVQAALTKSRDRDGVLRHFGVEPAAWQAIARAMSAALTASEPLRSRYEDLYRQAMQR